MAMTQQHKTLLIRNRLRLVREVFLSPEFYAILQSDYTLTSSMVEEIECAKTSQGKVGKLLDILPKRGGEAFPTFIEALIETHQPQLAALLDPSRALPSSSSSGGFISQPKDQGHGGDRLTPSATSSSADKPSIKKGGNDVKPSGKQPQQPTDAISEKPSASKGPIQDHKPNYNDASAKIPCGNVSGFSDVEEITNRVQQCSDKSESFIYEIYSPDVGDQPGKTESLKGSRCIAFRSDLLKKQGYDTMFDEINLIETFKKFGIEFGHMLAAKSPAEIRDHLRKEVASPLFFFMFAPAVGDSIVMDDGKSISTVEIVDIVRASAALKGKPKVLIFHLTDSGSGDCMDSIAEPPIVAPSLEFSSLSLDDTYDNLAILKVTPPSEDKLKIHWLVSSLVLLMTKYSKKYDLVTILDRVRLILEKQGYSVTLTGSLKRCVYFTS